MIAPRQKTDFVVLEKESPHSPSQTRLWEEQKEFIEKITAIPSILVNPEKTRELEDAISKSSSLYNRYECANILSFFALSLSIGIGFPLVFYYVNTPMDTFFQSITLGFVFSAVFSALAFFFTTTKSTKHNKDLNESKTDLLSVQKLSPEKIHRIKFQLSEIIDDDLTNKDFRETLKSLYKKIDQNNESYLYWDKIIPLLGEVKKKYNMERLQRQDDRILKQ